MPINIPDKLPAIGILANENIFLMPESIASQQDIRPLRILMLNLMPKKIETETHFLRMLSNSPIQIEFELLQIAGHASRNTPKEHTDNFYRTFEQVKEHTYDGLIITGAPLGLIPFEDVSYWDELTEIMDWSKEHVTSTVFVCWAALAAARHFYGIEKQVRSEKLFGVFEHKIIEPTNPIVRGGDDYFWAPHSRNGEIRREDILAVDDLHIVADSERCLKHEYFRDLQAGLNPRLPENYFPDDDITKEPVVRWRSHGNLIFANWLNYFVYQKTPFRLE